MELSDRKGIVLMIIAMLTIPLVDGIAKFLSSEFSPLFISWARYAVACFFVLPFAFIKRGTDIFPKEKLGIHFLRTVFLVSAMALYFISISLIPLATAISAYFIGPIVAVVLGVFFLKEKLTAIKLLSLFLGFAGSMVILNPGSTWDPGIVMAFGSGCLFALYMITSRMTSVESDPIKTLALQCVMGSALLFPFAFIFWKLPSLDYLHLYLGLGLFSAIGHIMTIYAFRFADASTLAPLVYVELVATVLVGYFVFYEVPSISTTFGAMLIVLSGLLLFKIKSRGV
ncbi:MAG: DMT family transporter [Lentilitoribacter sp.]